MVKSRYEITKKEISVIGREDSFNTTFKMWKSETEIINYETLDELTNTNRRNTGDFVASQLSIVFQVFRSVSATIGNR